MGNPDQDASGVGAPSDGKRFHYYCLIVLLVAAAVYAGCMISPPSLMDDVDAVQAQIARNMLVSGDYVTARLDGIPYLEKAPLIYWLIAGSFKVFGATDWAARIPMVLAALALAWLTTAFGRWAFGIRAGFYAGLCISTCFGLFLFTRILIPDVMLTGAIALSMWAFLRAIDEDERRPRWWAFVMAASLGTSLLFKSLVGVVFPVAAALIYLVITRQLFHRKIWKALHPLTGLLVILLIAAPWHILAALRNPPFFEFTMRSAPGEYHGFLWFYFINEQLLRFLNMRYPRDYDTVPRLYFWGFHLLWLFPWSVYFPAITRLNYKPLDRAGRTRLLALCWAGFILVFFTFSTTQEYYSMPCYPALALLLGSAMAAGGNWIRYGTRVLCGVLILAAGAVLTLYFLAWNLATPGDISAALSPHPGAYKLSLGHMEDLTIASFAYLRLPLMLAAIAFLIGAAGTLRATGQRAFLAISLMAILFFQAARIAMAAFDPYLSSRPLAVALLRSPAGKLIVDHHYYTFSSIFFYTNRDALLLNGRFNNLVYGSYAPGAPNVFIDDGQWKSMWLQPDRCYLVITETAVDRLKTLVAPQMLTVVAESGGKLLLTNQPLLK
ncbi:MAG TPA: glycosyltransferase family 39 protein [Bryobacteraceae bacterium]|jgi:4-amino-4-deoxy-L-arabinose transferase-like glycosyltransferase|nr:glycosyltransferase family 39 protein [Bryobacteraceae bacterium]